MTTKDPRGGDELADSNEKAPALSLDDFLDVIKPANLSPEDEAYERAENERAARRKARIVSPAPWSYEDTYDAACGSCCTPDGCPENHRAGLYHIVGPDWYDYDTVYPDVVCNEADARLIAAAPDMYEALKAARAHVAASAEASHLLQGFDRSETAEDRLLQTVDAAISKAAGTGRG